MLFAVLKARGDEDVVIDHWCSQGRCYHEVSGLTESQLMALNIEVPRRASARMQSEDEHMTLIETVNSWMRSEPIPPSDAPQFVEPTENDVQFDENLDVLDFD